MHLESPSLRVVRRISRCLEQVSSPCTNNSLYPLKHRQTAVTVLLVDDQPMVSEALQELLFSETDITFHYCKNPHEALQKAIEVKPTVILQDLVMPEVDGLMLVKLFRTNPATCKVPIIVLSNSEEAVIKADAFTNGANDYLIKLPDPIELIARLRYHSTAYHNLIQQNAAEKTLEYYNRDLEQRVQERTQALTTALEDLKQTQAQLVQNEKMSGLGQLVAGIAHEINNPVGFIHGNLSHISRYCEALLELVNLYQRDCSDPSEAIQEVWDEYDIDFVCEDLPRMLASSKMGTDRIKNLVLSLRTFSRFDQAPVKAVNLHDGIESTLVILQHKLKGIEIVKEYSALPPVECYASQMNQVFMNILANATYAVDSALEQNLIDEPKIIIRTYLLPTETIMIEIYDNGPGLRPEIQSKIFDPFFTTKPVGDGTGLGLSISYQIIVEQHHGQLTCRSIPGQGTTFCIELPISILED